MLKHHRFRRIGLLVNGALAVSIAILACSPSSRMTPLMEYAGVKDMSTAELRIRMHEFAVRYPVVIEEAAYAIESETENSDIWKASLLWKIYAIPAYHKAMFRVDPYAALIDAWVLTVQMKDYFESGAGAGVFGDHQHIALETAEALERELTAIALRALGQEGVVATREDINTWAAQHPIRSHFFVRDSVIPLVAEVMAGENRGWADGFSSLEESLQELRMRLTIYTDIIPKQVQWQLELTSLGLMEDTDIQTALQDISELRGNLNTMEKSLRGGFDRTAASIDGVDSSISGGFERLGEDLLGGIRKERVEALGSLSSDLETVAEDLKKILDEGAATYENRTKEVVDHIFWRGLILLAVFFAGLAVYRVTTARRRRD